MARRPRTPLIKQLSTRPARTLRDVMDACNPRVDLVGEDLAALRVDLSDVRQSPGVERIEYAIRNARGGDYQIHLVSGHSGSGKSTEMRWLERNLKLDTGDKVFYPIFIQMDDYLNEVDIQIPEFLTALIFALLEDVQLGPRLIALDFVRQFWRDIQEWFTSQGVTLPSDISRGLAKATFRSSPSFQQSFRQKNLQHVKRLVETLSDLIEHARAELIKEGTSDLIIMVNKLDRITWLPLGDNTKRTRHDLFYFDQLPCIEDVPAHFILTGPVTLHFPQNRLEQVFRRSTHTVLPLVAVHERGTERPNEAGIEALSRLLGRRVDLAETFADDEARRYAIQESGGCLRDLFRLVLEASLKKRALKLTRADIEVLANEQIGNTETMLQGQSFLRELHHIAKTLSFPEHFDDETKQWLLHNLVVIEYNGHTWYDVHPFAKRTRAFRDAAA